MNSHHIQTLSWRKCYQGDLSAAIRDVIGGVGSTEKLVQLCRHSLDENQLSKIYNALLKMRKRSDQCLSGLDSIRLAIIGNYTTDFIEPSVVASGVRYGLSIECLRGGYGQLFQDALSPSSNISQFQPDFTLVMFDYRDFFYRSAPNDISITQEILEEAKAKFQELTTGIRRKSKSVLIIPTIVRPVGGIFGSLEIGLPGASGNLIEAFNSFIRSEVQASNDILIDISELAGEIGSANWFSEKQWLLAKLPFGSANLCIYSDLVARLLGAYRGKSKRCLVMDLDNTMWGGVVGDDGIDGINISPGDPTGEAHLELQRTALEFRRRGVVLAVSSKNTDSVARAVFDKHPIMILKPSDISIFQANWEDKASNITSIAKSLNLGLDSIVFIDDNPMERELVRDLLPAVEVLEVPQDPTDYACLLRLSGFFEAIKITTEDFRRADYYSQNARRVTLDADSDADAGQLDSFLASMEMKLSLALFNRSGHDRTVQLINKSNQYNLTTKRYTSSDVHNLSINPNYLCLQAKLQDRLGDNGMISVVVCKIDQHIANVDLWLMSCRVLERRVEFAILNFLVEYLTVKGVSTILGTYIPTAKNSLVESHFDKLGFSLISCSSSGLKSYQLQLEQYRPAATPMTIVFES